MTNLQARIGSALASKQWKGLGPLVKKIGFADNERVLSNLKSLQQQKALRPALPRLLSLCAESPDPDRALDGFESVASAPGSVLSSLLRDERALGILVTAFALSPYFTTLLVRDPQILRWLFCEGGINTHRGEADHRAALQAFAEPIQDLADLRSKLRRFKQREVLRIGLRDLGGMAPFPEVAQEVSDLASACLELAYRYCYTTLSAESGRPPAREARKGVEPRGFVVLGMGKLGGRELNFSSDIDLQYLHTSDEGETEAGSGPDGQERLRSDTFFVKLAEMITGAMGEITEEGFVFRTDLRLRPHGKSGNITNSLRGAELYYASWGDTWERAALIKARPVAGDIDLGREFLQRVEPFVYRRYLDFTAIEEIQRMKTRLEQERASTRGPFNLKYMTGGIREVEFFVQALQLIYGGKYRVLREWNTLRTLEQLEALGIIHAEDHRCLREAYITWRTLEHRLQMAHNEQTHTLPDVPEDLARMARAIGYRGAKPGEALRADVQERAVAVREITTRLFARPSGAVSGETSDFLDLLPDPDAKERILEKLAASGFRAPERAYHSLLTLSQGEGPPLPRLSEQARRLLRRLAPAMLSEALESPSPEQALSHLEEFLTRVGARTSFYALLAENPKILTFLMRLFGTSPYLSSFFIQHPELLDTFVLAETSAPHMERDLMGRELTEDLRSSPSFEEKLDALRRFHHAELLRIGLNDLYGALDTQGVSAQLTDLAEVCLEAAWELCREELRPRYGVPMSVDAKRRQREVPMVILGLGALGAREMAYHSDLDLIFIYAGDGKTTRGFPNHDYFVRLAQRFISTLSSPSREGYAYQVDARLRPSGRFGPLVTSLEAFEAYHAEQGLTWERQSLLRARCVAGDERLATRVQEGVHRIVYERPFTEETIPEIHHLRERMRHELAREHKGRHNVKLGKGGLVEILFIVQLLQLQFGRTHQALRRTNTVEALTQLRTEELLTEGDYQILISAYHFLRHLENGLRLIHDRSLNEFREEAGELGELARHLYRGDPPPEERTQGLLQEFLGHTEAVREIYCRFFRTAE
ncbi:MAG: bifunctional [glutamate--ammonia ligase]-adenylyl-L-tyrosine phosphorylase/[glutamate--ammonia-ligase] adenylyltransferase [candidate division NC10 bacterium]|nr:bifunctional [glutamate--ammonia ligase]-adenylyl-L-tyrosine phosphorylase/[glutamate--ammonia-ligase] adenylyltransferase [candidate division NC10 bacterium]